MKPNCRINPPYSIGKLINDVDNVNCVVIFSSFKKFLILQKKKKKKRKRCEISFSPQTMSRNHHQVLTNNTKPSPYM